MKVTVKDYLNVRVGKPSVNAPTFQYLAPGSQIEVDGQLYKGDAYDGVDSWVKDETDKYYWSGGIHFNKDEKIDISYWVNFFGLNKLALQYERELENASITILDTGINLDNEDLIGVLDQTRNFFFSNKTVNDFDGHGTFCSGIIGGNGHVRISGGASGIRLNMGKVLTSSQPGLTGLTEGVLITALQWASELSDVISISAGIPSCTDALKKIVDDLAKKGKIIVAAIGNVGASQTGNYPAMLDGCISVGALTNNFEISEITIREKKIDICAPGENIISTLPKALGLYGSKTGTSVATPLIASIIYYLKVKDPSLDVSGVRAKLMTLSDTKITNEFKYLAIKPQTIVI